MKDFVKLSDHQYLLIYFSICRLHANLLFGLSTLHFHKTKPNKKLSSKWKFLASYTNIYWINTRNIILWKCSVCKAKKNDLRYQRKSFGTINSTTAAGVVIKLITLLENNNNMIYGNKLELFKGRKIY